MECFILWTNDSQTGVISFFFIFCDHLLLILLVLKRDIILRELIIIRFCFGLKLK